MIVRKVIHEELGQDLEKIGFKFVPGERMFWPYEREKDGVKQEIVIERERYIKNAIRVMFSTNAYGTGGKEFMDFVPEEGVKHRFWWVHENEKELREILREFKRLIFAYGLELLESISKPTTDVIPTAEKQRYLYEHHQELFEEYEEKLGTKGKKPEEALEIIHEAMVETLDEPFSEVEDMLLGLAALYGHTICGVNGWKWSWNDESRECVIRQASGKAKEENMLRTIIFSWDSWRKNRKQRKEENPLFKAYEDIIKLNRESGE